MDQEVKGNPQALEVSLEMAVIGRCYEFPWATGEKKRVCVARGPPLGIRKNFLAVNVKSTGSQDQREGSGMCLP